MANVAKNAILRAKIEGVLTDIMVKTTAANVFVDDTTTLVAKLATLAAKADLEALQQTVEGLGTLSGKDKVSEADLDTALAAILNGKATIASLNEEIDRAKAAEKENSEAAAAAKSAADKAQGDVDALAVRVGTAESDIDAVEGKVTTLIGDDANKSVRTIANEELAAKLIPEGAQESLDTLAEIAAWIQEHPGDASAMNQAITALQNKVDTGDKNVSAYVADAIAALKIGDYAKAADLTALAGRVSTVEGKVATLEETATGLGDLAVKDLVAEADLEASLKEKVNAAAEGNHSHSNKTELDKIVTGDKAKWDASEQNAKDFATGLNTAMDTRVKAVEEKSHTHANKNVLDGITADQLTAFGKKANIYYSASEPENLAEGDLWVALV